MKYLRCEMVSRKQKGSGMGIVTLKLTILIDFFKTEGRVGGGSHSSRRKGLGSPRNRPPRGHGSFSIGVVGLKALHVSSVVGLVVKSDNVMSQIQIHETKMLAKADGHPTREESSEGK